MLIYYVESGIYLVLGVVAFALEAWALFDCLRHKASAFEAVSKRTKTFWLALTGGAFAVGLFSLLSQLGSGGGAGSLGIFGLAAVTAASVYLADVRPAVKDAGRGRNMGPYGPW
jgi:O-antigen/teichoic acid export membrane protein